MVISTDQPDRTTRPGPGRPQASLSALRSFEAVARCGGFRRAAADLGVTHSAVSQQVGRLEATLGTRVLERDRRSIKLTSEGHLLYAVLRDAFGRIEQGVALVRGAPWTRSITLQAGAIVVLRWLNGRLGRFHRAHRDIELCCEDGLPDGDFDASRSDLGIVYVRGVRRPELIYEPLFEAMLYPVCRRGLGGGIAEGRSRAKLFSQPLLEVHAEDWPTWLNSAGIAHPEPIGTVRVDSYLLALEMAAAGQGIAMLNGPFAAADLRAGRLERVLRHEAPAPGEWCLVHARERDGEPGLEAVRRWLLQEARRA